MPLGIVSNNEFESELANSDSQDSIPSPVSGVIHNIKSPGRGEGNANVPDSLRKIIGETSEIDGRREALALAKEFGISSQSVSAYANGSTSLATYDKKDTGLAKYINARKEKISNRAQKKLLLALDGITEERIGEAKLRDLAIVAKMMSGVVKDMEPEKEKEKESTAINNVQFVMFAPPMIKESSLETITVNE